MEKKFSVKCSPKMLAHCSWSLVRETQTGKYKRQRRRSECYMTNLFVVRIPYRGSFHYLRLNIVIKNQHITFLLKTYFLNIVPPPSKLVGDGAIWLSYSDSATIRTTLNFNRERKKKHFAD
jgi:hypothetical protein